MMSEVIVRFVDRQRWLDRAGDALGKVASATFDNLGPLSKPVEDLLHGTPFGHPLHPAITDIPVGAWTATFAMDIAGIEDGADFALKVGLVGALSAAVAGLADWRYTSGTQRRTGVAHALFNVTATTLYSASAVQRGNGNRAAGVRLANLGYLCVMCGGILGGDLTYALGTMVNRQAWTSGGGDYTPIMPLVDLQDDTPTHVDANGEDLVLIRRGERVFALANSCSHLGGPLAEGKLEGDCIVCPWHGSQFKLDTGRVAAGPSAYHQPAYDVRVRGGIVEVRLTGEYGEREPGYRVSGRPVK